MDGSCPLHYLGKLCLGRNSGLFGASTRLMVIVLVKSEGQMVNNYLLFILARMNIIISSCFSSMVDECLFAAGV
jgi:hypothetical protein